MNRATAWERATQGRAAPFAVVDLDAFDTNAADLARRAAGRPIRVASKSIRVRHLLQRALEHEGFAGVMSYSLREALWLSGTGVRDLFVAYPTTDRGALEMLAHDEQALEEIAIAVDSAEQVDALQRWLPAGAPVRVVIDVDASLRVGPAHLGVRRSPIRSPRRAAAVATAARRAGLRVVGLMFYDAQIAGLPDSSAAVRFVKARSDASLQRRRGAVRRAVEEAVGPLRIVNGGGTGSLEVTGTDPALTELAAGSGLVGPTLFDGYDAFSPQPAVAFALPVVRRPAKNIVTVFSGGYIASGPAGANRVPSVHHPRGLDLISSEGAGEVQTPLRGKAARDLDLGDRVWFRHAKAGELAERFDEYVVVRGDEVVDVVPTYRGEGKNFG
ncbi:alanine racemase [Janibacter cremeus]|uniref:D-serine deaminase-like pyridoxal phosphate-dependent protein n=1 Tax=Janibacter cremeus TaxID=1285192 RepID=A0A852VST6_9MICO|nr:alanine racemase [Janibacter cremeus]NYF97743.1 D-serine deaminase-like pyridoxal phosphate-dependent protein [Janibacter cremeus]